MRVDIEIHLQLQKHFGSNVLVEGGYGCCLNKKARRVADQIFWTTRTIYVCVVFFYRSDRQSRKP